MRTGGGISSISTFFCCGWRSSCLSSGCCLLLQLGLLFLNTLLLLLIAFCYLNLLLVGRGCHFHPLFTTSVHSPETFAAFWLVWASLSSLLFCVCSSGLLHRHVLERWPTALQAQHRGWHPSITTYMGCLPHIKVFGISINFFLVTVTQIWRSLVAIPDLLLMDKTSKTLPDSCRFPLSTFKKIHLEDVYQASQLECKGLDIGW